MFYSMAPGLLFAVLLGFVTSDGVPTWFAPALLVVLVSVLTLSLCRLWELRALVNCSQWPDAKERHSGLSRQVDPPMKITPKPLTFGDLIASIYGACDPRRAAGLLRLAVNAKLLSFPGQRRVGAPHPKP
jgi:hypothetical protein